MSEEKPDRFGRFYGLTVLVCLSATALAGFLGFYASFLYGGLSIGGSRDPAVATVAAFTRVYGALWGAVTGLMAGLIWCRSMYREVAHAETVRFGAAGAWLGLKVGALSTVLLHVGLVLAGGHLMLLDRLPALPFGLALGLVFGIPAGSILGAICGCAYRAAIVRRSGADEDHASEHPDVDQPGHA